MVLIPGLLGSAANYLYYLTEADGRYPVPHLHLVLREMLLLEARLEIVFGFRFEVDNFPELSPDKG